MQMDETVQQMYTHGILSPIIATHSQQQSDVIDLKF